MINSKVENHPVDLDRHTLQLFDATPVPMFCSSVTGDLEKINPALIQFLGFQQDEIHLPDFMIYHQDKFKLDKTTLDSLNADSSFPVVIETKYEHSSGAILSAQLTVVPQLNNSGEIIRYISQIVTSAVENKKSDQLQLASLVYAKSSEGMMITDKDGVIVDVNSSFTKITGYLKEDVCGKNARILSSGQQDDLFYKLMWNRINTSGHWKGELWNRKKNGIVYPVIISINTDFDKQGKVNKRVALFSDLTDIKAKERQIFKQAYYDTITGLPNRALFIERLNHIINLTKSKENSIALMLLDLDGFKEVNDTLGHEAGDELLKLTAERLLLCVKENGDVARLGGDEFTIILHDIKLLENTVKNILKKLAQPYSLENEEIYITGSIGITLFPDDSDQVSGLLKSADQAMYAVKKQGRNGFSYFTHSMHQEALDRLSSINELREGIEKQQFILHYQPIVKLANNEISKAEALVRWLHPEKGIVSPDQFIPIAEETGLIIEIGRWVVNEALQQVYVWRETVKENFQLSINESPLQFKSDENSFNNWFAYLEKLDLPGESVSIEITENLLMDFSESVDMKMQKFKDANIQISLDDFGTGYASLSYLKRFDIEFLKIDKSYVQSMEQDKDVLILCESIIQMAHKLDIQVIAEGIETQQQLDILKSLDCDYGQG
ncbi:MAG: EAL domain-containing protein, partial [Gammaproteobacteria bacterium]|nr:EAL domain-containing protein [Gammaproteobacteria bacterium]